MSFKKFLRDTFLKLRIIFFKKKNYFLFSFFIFLSFFFFSLFLIYPNPSKEKVYKEGITEEVFILTPYLTNNETEKTISNIIYPSLFEFYNGDLISKFVEKYFWNKEENTLEIKIYDNLFWSDGEPLTTEDIRFGLEFLKKFAPNEISKFFKDVEFKIINDKQGVFNYKNQNNYFLYNLKYLKPLPSKIFSKYSPNFKDFDLVKIGSGPFVLKEISNSDKKIIILEKNKKYKNPIFLEEVRFIYYPNQRELINGLINKEIDGFFGFAYPDLTPGLKKRIKVYRIIMPRVIGLFFNKDKVKEEKIIESLNGLIDREKILKEIFQGEGEISYGIFSPSLRKRLKIEDLKIEKREEKIPTTTFNIFTSKSYIYPDLARYLKEKYNLNYTLLNSEELNNLIKNKDYEVILYGLNYNYPPELFYFWSQGGLNLNSFKNQFLEKKFSDILTNPQIDIFKENGEIEKEILKEKANIFLINPYYLGILDKNIKGFDIVFLNEFNERFVKIENIKK